MCGCGTPGSTPSLESDGSLWMVTQLPTKASWLGEDGCGEHKEPREEDQASGLHVHGHPVGCAEESWLSLGDLGWDQGRSRRGPTCLTGPSGAKAADCCSQPTVYLETPSGPYLCKGIYGQFHLRSRPWVSWKLPHPGSLDSGRWAVGSPVL